MMRRLVKLILLVAVAALAYTANAMIQAWYEAVYNLNAEIRFRHTLFTRLDYSSKANCGIPYISYDLWNYKAYPWSSSACPFLCQLFIIIDQDITLRLADMVNKSAR